MNRYKLKFGDGTLVHPKEYDPTIIENLTNSEDDHSWTHKHLTLYGYPGELKKQGYSPMGMKYYIDQ